MKLVKAIFRHAWVKKPCPNMVIAETWQGKAFCSYKVIVKRLLSGLCAVKLGRRRRRVVQDVATRGSHITSCSHRLKINTRKLLLKHSTQYPEPRPEDTTGASLIVISSLYILLEIIFWSEIQNVSISKSTIFFFKFYKISKCVNFQRKNKKFLQDF